MSDSPPISARSPAAADGSAPADPDPFARQLLRSMLPQSVPGAAGFDVAAGTMLVESVRPTTVWDTVLIGGRRPALLAFDIKVPAAAPIHLLAMARAAVRAAADDRPLGEILVRVNHALATVQPAGAAPVLDCAVVVPGDGGVEWSSAGRIPAAVLGRDGDFRPLGSHGPPLGMLDGFRYGTEWAPMGSGSSLLVLAGGTPGLFRGAADLVAEVQEKTAGEIVGTVHRALRRAPGETPREVSVLFLRKH